MVQGKTRRGAFKRTMKKYWPLYLLLLPGLVYLVIYRYGPIFGLSLAFQDYRVTRTIFNSPWVGLKNFESLVKLPTFGMIFSNTIVISLMKIAFAFPAPILLALMLNDLRSDRFKRVLQTAYYLPHFISWIVLGNILYVLIAPSSGALSRLYMRFTGASQLDILMNKQVFRWLLVITDIWKGVGWGSIVYLAALAGIDNQLYEAAQVDGATRFQQMRFITLPMLLPTIMTMLLLRVGNIMDAGFDQIWVLQNNMVYDVSEILSTFIYKISFLQNQPSKGAAADMLKSVIGLVMVVSTNRLAKRFDQEVL